MASNKYKRIYPKLRESAAGEQCTLNLAPYCNGDPSTTVLCHLPFDSGMGIKSHDLSSAYGCSSCHAVIDGQMKVCDQLLPKEDIEAAKYRGHIKTLLRFIDKGLVTL